MAPDAVLKFGSPAWARTTIRTTHTECVSCGVLNGLKCRIGPEKPALTRNSCMESSPGHRGNLAAVGKLRWACEQSDHDLIGNRIPRSRQVSAKSERISCSRKQGRANGLISATSPTRSPASSPAIEEGEAVSASSFSEQRRSRAIRADQLAQGN